MADRLDVTTRLAEGQPAVDHLQTYVRACEAVGYQQPDLTAHASQVGDWYETEVGLDLRVLDGDITELRAAVTAIDEALWMQRTQVTELAAAWRGAGAESAARFLERHCDVAEEVSGHIRAAAEHCAVLRDDVWQAVDGKVATTVTIDERSAAQRSTWLAAAQAVTAGDRSASEVIVQRQVMPFVDNDIRNDWLAAMSSANASIAASYDTAIHALASMRDVRFDIPGDLGPSRQPEERTIPAMAPSLPLPPGPQPPGPLPPSALPPGLLPAGPLPTVPAAAAAPEPRPEPAQPLPTDEPEEIPSALTDSLGDADGLSGGTGGLGGLGGMTGGIGGVVSSIVDSIGSLLGSLAGGAGNGPGIEDDPLGLDDGDNDPVLDGDDKADEAEETAEPAAVDHTPVPEAAVAENPPAATEAVAEPVAQPVDSPPEATPPADPPAPAAPPDGSTPCEIAEDQLPQAGQ